MAVAHEIEGNGPHKVIVMHDWMSTLRSYDNARPILDRETFTYAFMDHRGYGRSRDQSGVNTAKEASEDVVALADALGWDGFHVVGHSMSAMIAQRVSLDARDRVRSVVALTPVPACGVPLDAEGMALFTGAAADDEQWTMVSRMVTGNRLPDQWYRQKLEQFRASVDPASFLRFLSMWTTTDFSAEMIANPIPALVVLGKHDIPAFSEQAMRQTLAHWYRHCTIEIIESAGHYPMSETPPHFVSVLENFLRLQG